VRFSGNYGGAAPSALIGSSVKRSEEEEEEMQPRQGPAAPPKRDPRLDHGRQRLARLTALARAELNRPSTPAERHLEVEDEVAAGCLLHKAFGRDIPCARGACPFYDVPGFDGCAVRAWHPKVTRDRAAAGWFLERRVDAWFAQRRRDGAEAGPDAEQPGPAAHS